MSNVAFPVFVGAALQPQVRYVRRRGRPRQEWVTELMKAAAQRLGSTFRLQELLLQQDASAAITWKAAVERMFARSHT